MDALVALKGNETALEHAAVFNGNLWSSDVILWNVGVQESADRNGLTRLRSNVERVISNYKSGQDGGVLWWRETLPQHFEGGSYDIWKIMITRKERKTKRPMCINASKWKGDTNTLPLGIYNNATSAIMVSSGVPIMPMYKSALPMHMAHYNPGQDCTHFCPGEFGPPELYKATLTSMVRHAVAASALPPPSGVSFQRRWDVLMEHPYKSVLSHLEACGNSKFRWDLSIDGKPPRSLLRCLCSTIRVKGQTQMSKSVIKDLNLSHCL
jgi:hypothetical protein